MSKKDYKKLANILKFFVHIHHDEELLIADLCDMLARDNPKFDINKFNDDIWTYTNVNENEQEVA